MSDFSILSVRVSPCCFKEISPAKNINIANLLYLQEKIQKSDLTLICIFVSESNAHLLLKTGRKESLQKAPPGWEVAQTLKARTETLLSIPYIAPVIVPDILPLEDAWKGICFLSDSALHRALGSCSLSPLSLTASISGDGKERNFSSKYYVGSVAHVEVVGGTPKPKVSGSDYIVSRSGDISRECFL